MTRIHSIVRRGRMRSGILFSILVLSMISSCRNDPVGVAEQPYICFRNDVLPVFQINCAKSGCHEARSRERMNLSTYDGIRANVTPFKPFESRLYTAMIKTWGGIMPPSPNPPLTLQQRTAVYLWILQGADSSCTR